MGIRDWFRRKPKQPATTTVRFYDVETGKVVNIPESELSEGVVEAQVQGVEGTVWVSPEQLQPGPIRHEPFDEEVRDFIRHIQAAFAEHRKLSFEEWEEGFRRDAEPLREIAFWSRAADVYVEFAGQEDSAERRRDIYRCIVACLTSSPDRVWRILKPKELERSEAEKIVRRFYGDDE